MLIILIIIMIALWTALAILKIDLIEAVFGIFYGAYLVVSFPFRKLYSAVREWY